MNALTFRAGSTSLAPQSFSEAVEFSKMLARSGMVPKDYVGKPENIMVALQWGAEVGLGPLQALNGISIMNGRPTLWGDAALALVRGHHACGGVREGVEGDGDARFGWCEVTRKGEAPQRRTFSMGDAKKAGLLGKTGPWSQYTDRMLQLRARGFAIRDVFPDALRGVITTEEAEDMPTTPALPAARGATIASTAERVRDMPAEVSLIVLAPDGTEKNAPSIQHWAKWCEKAIATMEDATALGAWRTAMAPHFMAAEHADIAAVEHVTGLAQDRLDALADAADGCAA